MKRIANLLLAIMALSLQGAYAQANIIVNEVMGFMSQGQQPGFEVFIPEAEKNSVENNWGKLMKGYKAKVSTSKKSIEVFADNASINPVSENTIDVYAIAQNAENGIKLVAFADLGGGFVNTSQYILSATAFEAIMRQFALDEMKRTVDRQIDDEESILKGLEKEVANLVKDKQGYQKEIEKCRATILQRQQDIVTNESVQATKLSQIQFQRQHVTEENQKLLKGLEKEYSNLLKDRESYQKEIYKCQATIPQREQDIVANENEQVTKKGQIDLQMQIVATVKQKRMFLGK